MDTLNNQIKDAETETTILMNYAMALANALLSDNENVKLAALYL